MQFNLHFLKIAARKFDIRNMNMWDKINSCIFYIFSSSIFFIFFNKHFMRLAIKFLPKGLNNVSN